MFSKQTNDAYSRVAVSLEGGEDLAGPTAINNSPIGSPSGGDNDKIDEKLKDDLNLSETKSFVKTMSEMVSKGERVTSNHIKMVFDNIVNLGENF